MIYRSLDANKIQETVLLLRDRIMERFPNSGLSRVAEEFTETAGDALAKNEIISRPNIPLRIVVWLLAVLMVTIVLSVAFNLRVSVQVDRISELAQGLESGINDIIFLGVAVYFLFTIENRLKRRATLRVIHELRSLAHIIDMHQLTKDPEFIVTSDKDTASSPERKMTRFELSRYLNYCSEMLSLIGKLAAMQVQRFDDPVVLSAVDQIEDLTTALCGKIWQKINILHRFEQA